MPNPPTTSPAPASGAETTYCAQCVLNGSGRFPMRDGDCTNPRCVLYMRHFVARPSWLALPTPPSDAGTSERETETMTRKTPVAHTEAWWLARIDREGDSAVGAGIAPLPSLDEWHRRVAGCASRATVKRASEEWPACDCGLAHLVPAAPAAEGPHGDGIAESVEFSLALAREHVASSVTRKAPAALTTYLSADVCPLHGHAMLAVMVVDATGYGAGTRLLGPKSCCAARREVARWPLTPDALQRLLTDLTPAPAAALPGAEAGTPDRRETNATMLALLDFGSALAVCDCADRKCVLNAADKLTNADIHALIAERRALTSEVRALREERDEARQIVRDWIGAVMAHYPMTWAFDSTAPSLMVENVVRAARLASPSPTGAP